MTSVSLVKASDEADRLLAINTTLPPSPSSSSDAAPESKEISPRDQESTVIRAPRLPDQDHALLSSYCDIDEQVNQLQPGNSRKSRDTEALVAKRNAAARQLILDGMKNGSKAPIEKLRSAVAGDTDAMNVIQEVSKEMEKDGGIRNASLIQQAVAATRISEGYQKCLVELRAEQLGIARGKAVDEEKKIEKEGKVELRSIFAPRPKPSSQSPPSEKELALGADESTNIGESEETTAAKKKKNKNKKKKKKGKTQVNAEEEGGIGGGGDASWAKGRRMSQELEVVEEVDTPYDGVGEQKEMSEMGSVLVTMSSDVVEEKGSAALAESVVTQVPFDLGEHDQVSISDVKDQPVATDAVIIATAGSDIAQGLGEEARSTNSNSINSPVEISLTSGVSTAKEVDADDTASDSSTIREQTTPIASNTRIHSPNTPALSSSGPGSGSTDKRTKRSPFTQSPPDQDLITPQTPKIPTFNKLAFPQSPATKAKSPGSKPVVKRLDIGPKQKGSLVPPVETKPVVKPYQAAKQESEISKGRNTARAVSGGQQDKGKIAPGRGKAVPVPDATWRLAKANKPDPHPKPLNAPGRIVPGSKAWVMKDSAGDTSKSAKKSESKKAAPSTESVKAVEAPQPEVVLPDPAVVTATEIRMESADVYKEEEIGETAPFVVSTEAVEAMPSESSEQAEIANAPSVTVEDVAEVAENTKQEVPTAPDLLSFGSIDPVDFIDAAFVEPTVDTSEPEEPVDTTSRPVIPSAPPARIPLGLHSHSRILSSAGPSPLGQPSILPQDSSPELLPTRQNTPEQEPDRGLMTPEVLSTPLSSTHSSPYIVRQYETDTSVLEVNMPTEMDQSDPKSIGPIKMNRGYTLFFTRPTTSAARPAGRYPALGIDSAANKYSEDIVPVFTAVTFADFFSCWKALRTSIAGLVGRRLEADLIPGSEGLGIHLFQSDKTAQFFVQGVRPMWEDPMCRNGGKIVITGGGYELDHMFFRIALNLIAGCFDHACPPPPGFDSMVVGAVQLKRDLRPRLDLWLGGSQTVPMKWAEEVVGYLHREFPKAGVYQYKAFFKK